MKRIRKMERIEWCPLTPQRLPRGYGLAYYDYSRGKAVCYPIPINVVVAWARSLWRRCRFRALPDPTQRERELKRAYERGIDAGRRVGYTEGLNDATRALRGRETDSPNGADL